MPANNDWHAKWHAENPDPVSFSIVDQEELQEIRGAIDGLLWMAENLAGDSEDRTAEAVKGTVTPASER